MPETARHENARESLQAVDRLVGFDFFGVDFVDLHLAIVGDASMDDGFVNRFVGVVEFDVFTHYAESDPVARGRQFADDLLPMSHVRRRRLKIEMPADQFVHALPLQDERHFVDRMVDVLFLDDRLERDVAEQRYFMPQVLFDRTFGTANHDVGSDPDFPEFGYRLLGGFGFQFAGGLDVRDVGDMDEHHVVGAHFQGEFSNGFQERKPLDIAGGSPDLGNDDPGLRFAGQGANPVFDLFGHVGNHLDGFSEVFSSALLIEHCLIDLTGRQIVEPGQLGAGESFVMPEIQIGFGPVVQDVDFAVLEGTQGPGIDIEVGIEFLEGDADAAIFQQGAERGGRQSFAQGTNHSSGDKNVFGRFGHVQECFAIKVSTWAMSSGKSTPTLRLSTWKTVMSKSLSKARNCSSRSAFSKGEIGSFTNFCKASRR